MQYAISERTGVFSLALAPWVIAIASAGAAASGTDLEPEATWEVVQALQDSRTCESTAVANFLRV